MLQPTPNKYLEITSHLMRRLALLHGLLSFAFNTIIVAPGININS
ncbi:MAG TPA: DUF1345 domain-containing protein [Candidatus Sericytochromatia bacterium]